RGGAVDGRPEGAAEHRLLRLAAAHRLRFHADWTSRGGTRRGGGGELQLLLQPGALLAPVGHGHGDRRGSRPAPAGGARGGGGAAGTAAAGGEQHHRSEERARDGGAHRRASMPRRRRLEARRFWDKSRRTRGGAVWNRPRSGRGPGVASPERLT